MRLVSLKKNLLTFVGMKKIGALAVNELFFNDISRMEIVLCQ
jgi:hypothetical protein